jgi:hypothetical protein
MDIRVGALSCAIALSCLLAGCTGLETHVAPHANGVPYYLPRSLVELTFTPSAAATDQQPEQAPTVTAKNVEIADLSQRYVASYAASPYSDDRLCIARTETGLLKKVYFSADDRLDDFLLNVIQLLAGFDGAKAPPGKLNMRAGPRAPVSMLVDPFDRQQIAAFNRLIKPYRVEFPALPSRKSNFVCPPDTICFATRVSVPIALMAGTTFIGQSKVDIVDASNHGSINVQRAFMTERVTKLDLTDGILTSLRVRKNSEALAASEFPLKAIERLLAVPGNAVAVALSGYEEKKAYLERQKALGITPLQSSQATGLPVDIGTCLGSGAT